MHRRKHSNEPAAGTSSQQPDPKDESSSRPTTQRQTATPDAAIWSAAVLLTVVGAVLILLLYQPNPDEAAHQGDTTYEAAGVERFATGLQPPYYSVIFTSQRKTGVGDAAYAAMAALMAQLASEQPGYLGVESTRGPDGLGITVSYWRDVADIANWRRQLEHVQARDGGRARWYSHYELRVAKVERAYAWDASEGPAAPSKAQEIWLQQDSRST